MDALVAHMDSAVQGCIESHEAVEITIIAVMARGQGKNMHVVTKRRSIALPRGRGTAVACFNMHGTVHHHLGSLQLPPIF